MAAKKTVGRPPKFQEPCRPVTMTLPQRTINKLTEISEDRAQAVVKAVDACVPDNPEHQPLVSLIDIGTNESVIVVGKSTMLGQISGLRLIEISPGRFLLSVPLETPIERVEVALLDILQQLPEEETRERRLLMSISQSLNSVRRERRISKAEILVIVKKH